MSDDDLQQDLRQISERVRRWRDDAGLTLQELAAKSGVATSTIQKIETEQMIPSIAVLLKVARGLGRRPSDLVSEDGEALERIHLRAGERHPVGAPGKLVVERLTGDLQEPALETWRITVHPGHGSGDAPIRFDGEELVICEEGAVTFLLDGEPHVLEAGDTLHFKARIPHSWRNDSDAPARLTITGTLPAIFRAAMQRPLRSVG